MAGSALPAGVPALATGTADAIAAREADRAAREADRAAREADRTAREPDRGLRRRGVCLVPSGARVP